MFNDSPFRLKLCLQWLASTFILASVCAQAEQESHQTLIESVPVIEEPLHQVQYRSDDFIIYTNHIEPGAWTDYHRHHNDLLAVLAADASVSAQQAHSDKQSQTAPAGSVMYFPYAESAAPYVHRLTATGDSPFVNVGLEFQQPAVDCPSNHTASHWRALGLEAVASNRRGQVYRLTLPADTELNLPDVKGPLLFVPLSEASLRVGNFNWDAALGDFQFFEREPPTVLKNLGLQFIELVVFEAC